MKTMILLSVLLLSGCFVGIQYDNFELYLVSEVRTDAERFDCENSLYNYAQRMDRNAHSFVNFAEFSSGHETFEVAKELKSLTSEFFKRFDGLKKPSKTYCELKLKNIITASERIAKSMGGKIR